MNRGAGRVDHALSPDVVADVGSHADSSSIENLTLDRDPSAPVRRCHWARLVILTVVCSLAAVAMVAGQDHREPAAIGAPPTPLDVLVLGDTSARSDGCTRCLTYVDQLAAAWSQGGRRQVRIDDRSESADVAPSSMPALVESLRSDPDIRAAVSDADVIVLAVGNGDVAHRAAPTPELCRAERQSRCPGLTIGQFRDSLRAWIAETDTIRHYRPLTLRVITPAPTSGSPRQNHVARTTCLVVAAHDGDCINLYNLARSDEHIVAAGTDPRHPQLTQHGHDLVATQLISLGIT